MPSDNPIVNIAGSGSTGAIESAQDLQETDLKWLAYFSIGVNIFLFALMAIKRIF